MFEDTNPRDLKELLAQIHSADSVLPEFQRDFVWDPSATRELIISIAKGFPAGSILRIRNTNNLFAFRAFENAPPLNGKRPVYLVLDGQQRLTSLYQAFYGVGDHRYFINIKKLLNGEDVDECITSERHNRPYAKRYTGIDNQAADLIAPLSILARGDSGFYDWMRKVSRILGGDDASAVLGLQDELQLIADRWIKTIDGYRFPVVTLSDNTDAEAVCTIFETLNRTGVKLTAFDLLTARFWHQDINLRGLWDDAKQEHPILEQMEIDPYYLLQAMSLCARKPPGCKRSEVLSLESDAFRYWWPKVVGGYADTLTILQEDCGVLAPRWLPYAAIPIPMAAIQANASSISGPTIGANRKQLVRWYWCSVLNQTYDNPPNSQAAKDFGELQRWLDGGDDPESVANFNIDRVGDLHTITFRQRALYRGLMGLVLRNSPRDFHKGALITGEAIQSQKIDDHHIFPDAYLREQGKSGDYILNRTLIDSETNKKIGKNAPSVYIPEIESALQVPSTASDLFESHFCSLSHLNADDFEGFIAAREQKFREAIAEVTG